MNQTVVETITNFVESIGLSVITRTIEQQTFLPGLLLENGKIIIDPDKLLYPGDILHEAGHLATAPAGVREAMSDQLPVNDWSGGSELMALGWSYAACLRIGLDPHIVFHPEGYKGESESLIENFSQGRYLGVPGLEYRGLTYDKKRAKEFNALPYPNMLSWITKTL